MSSTGDRQRWSDERQRFDDVQRRVRSDAGPQTRWSDPGSSGRGWSRFAEGGEVAKRHVRLGRRVVLHLLTQPVTEHDRGVLEVNGTGEEELPSRHRVVPAGDPDLVSAARCRMPSGPSKPASVELMSDGSRSVMAVQGGRYRVCVPIFPRDTSDMPKKRGDRAQKTAEQRAGASGVNSPAMRRPGKNTSDLWWNDHMTRGSPRGSIVTMAPLSTSGRPTHHRKNTSARC